MRDLRKITCLALALTFMCSTGCSLLQKPNNESSSSSLEDTSSTEDVVGDEIGYLCDNGASGYDIVIPTDAGEGIRYAAEEIVSFVKEATGDSLTVK